MRESIHSRQLEHDTDFLPAISFVMDTVGKYQPSRATPPEPATAPITPSTGSTMHFRGGDTIGGHVSRNPLMGASPQLRQQVEEILADLNAESYQVRQEANQRMIRVGRAALPYIRQAAANCNSLEIRNRIERFIIPAILRENPIETDIFGRITRIGRHAQISYRGDQEQPHRLELQLGQLGNDRFVFERQPSGHYSQSIIAVSGTSTDTQTRSHIQVRANGEIVIQEQDAQGGTHHLRIRPTGVLD